MYFQTNIGPKHYTTHFSLSRDDNVKLERQIPDRRRTGDSIAETEDRRVGGDTGVDKQQTDILYLTWPDTGSLES